MENKILKVTLHELLKNFLPEIEVSGKWFMSFSIVGKKYLMYLGKGSEISFGEKKNYYKLL